MSVESMNFQRILSAAAHQARRRFFQIICIGLALVCAGSVIGFAQAPQFTPRDENVEDLPAGPGRDEAFYSCTPCHNFKLVAAQGMNRRQWEDSLSLMVTKHNMPPLEGDDRKLVLDYLEATYPSRAPSGGSGWQNPFLKR